MPLCLADPLCWLPCQPEPVPAPGKKPTTVGFPHAALKGRGRTDHSASGRAGVWASRTHSFEHCSDQAGECMGRRVWWSLVWKVQFSSRVRKHPLLPLQPCLCPCDSCSLGRSPWQRWPGVQPVRPLYTCWPCSPCSSRPPLPGKHTLSLMGGRGTCPALNSPLSHSLPRAELLLLLIPLIWTHQQCGWVLGKW